MNEYLSPEIRAKMDAFLNRYNPGRQEEVAITLAIGAAVGHNDLYRRQPELPRAERDEIRDHWMTELRLRRQKYSVPMSDADYEDDVVQLESTMNERFSAWFRGAHDARAGHRPGFRISHSQKSISVFLKHVWCIERDEFPPPPQCPVDRMILAVANAPWSMRSWTRVDSIDEHRAQVAWLRGRAHEEGLPLQHWELKHFPG